MTPKRYRIRAWMWLVVCAIFDIVDHFHPLTTWVWFQILLWFSAIALYLGDIGAKEAKDAGTNEQ